MESLLHSHPAVADVAVIGLPDEEAGELPTAYLVLKPKVKVTENEIVKFVEGNFVKKTKPVCAVVNPLSIYLYLFIYCISRWLFK